MTKITVAEKPKKSNLTNWLLLLVALLLIGQLFTPKKGEKSEAQGVLTVEALKDEFVEGTEVLVNLKNNSAVALRIPSACPRNPLTVQKLSGASFTELSAESSVDCKQFPDITLAADGGKARVSFRFWNHALFTTGGTYKVSATAFTEQDEKITADSPPFEIASPGILRQFFRRFFYQPIFNLLILLIKIAPGQSLAFAIIVLTLLIKLALLIPSQRALVSQKKMQELQPKLAEIRQKHSGDQEKIAQETMQIWKQYKVNPFGSCLPLVLQLPVLIALFYVIQNGLNPDNTFLMYESLKSVDLSKVDTNFLGILDLLTPNRYVLPLIVGGLQFLQMKLAMAKKEAKEQKAEGQSEMEFANKAMTYMLPVMIAVFTASLPAGVGLYWGVSTLFALGQQVVVNRKN